MAVLNSGNNASSLISQALGGKPAGRGNEPRPQAEFFINVGVLITRTIERDGEMVEEEILLSLPFGLPLDTMNELVIRGNNEQWNADAAARNELLKALVKMGEGLDAGTGKMLPKLAVQLYRRKDQVEAAADNSTMATILSALS
ncbi:hypothetical protein DNY80_22920 [Salmonella enterica subsp. enterica serovar Kentucky]|nr:hypothetical protein [Salmonella enterica subsp. enterica serovar Kentucky]